jgi:hypothetical protein
MARDIDFRASGGRESLWTTGEKTGFSRVHCEVPKLVETSHYLLVQTFFNQVLYDFLKKSFFQILVEQRKF